MMMMMTMMMVVVRLLYGGGAYYAPNTVLSSLCTSIWVNAYNSLRRVGSNPCSTELETKACWSLSASLRLKVVKVKPWAKTTCLSLASSTLTLKLLAGKLNSEVTGGNKVDFYIKSRCWENRPILYCRIMLNHIISDVLDCHKNIFRSVTNSLENNCLLMVDCIG